MADKSREQLATELTIEYIKANPSTELDELQEVWCRFYETIKAGIPSKAEEEE